MMFPTQAGYQKVFRPTQPLHSRRIYSSSSASGATSSFYNASLILILLPPCLCAFLYNLHPWDQWLLETVAQPIIRLVETCNFAHVLKKELLLMYSKKSADMETQTMRVSMRWFQVVYLWCLVSYCSTYMSCCDDHFNIYFKKYFRQYEQ